MSANPKSPEKPADIDLEIYQLVKVQCLGVIVAAAESGVTIEEVGASLKRSKAYFANAVPGQDDELTTDQNIRYSVRLARDRMLYLPRLLTEKFNEFCNPFTAESRDADGKMSKRMLRGSPRAALLKAAADLSMKLPKWEMEIEAAQLQRQKEADARAKEQADRDAIENPQPTAEMEADYRRLAGMTLTLELGDVRAAFRKADLPAYEEYAKGAKEREVENQQKDNRAVYQMVNGKMEIQLPDPLPDNSPRPIADILADADRKWGRYRPWSNLDGLLCWPEEMLHQQRKMAENYVDSYQHQYLPLNKFERRMQEAFLVMLEDMKTYDELRGTSAVVGGTLEGR